MRKNIIISGTTLWNPGDDFIREGVINILKELFPEGINFFFYDFCPEIENKKIITSDSRADKNSIEQMKDFIDYIVITGIGAGQELIPLYNWILQNNLQSKCILIGGYYTNEYARYFAGRSPCKEILDSARIVISRSPALTSEKHIYIPCPAGLCNYGYVKRNIINGINNIGFSIQLADNVINQHCKKEIFDLAMTVYANTVMTGLYDFDIICHYKTEYVYFLSHDIKHVVFNSFYTHLKEIYSKYDLIISTRLHSGIFANTLGIPAIIINNHFRHKETLRDYPISFLVDNLEDFRREFTNIKAGSLQKYANDSLQFTEDLMQKYLKVLKEVV